MRGVSRTTGAGLVMPLSNMTFETLMWLLKSIQAFNSPSEI